MTFTPLSLRATIGLCFITLLMALFCCWALMPVGTLPGSGLIKLELLPNFLAGFALLLATFALPLTFSKAQLLNDPFKIVLTKATLAALWFGAASAYLMLAASRMSSVEAAGIIQAALWIACCALLAVLLERLTPKAGVALLFFWIVALPICAYMLAEVFLTGPAGGIGLAQSTAPEAAALRAVIRWMLQLSPGTATFGALTGRLADGGAYCSIAGALTMSTCVAAMVFLGFKRRLPTDE
jgi:hypothetical protein